MHTLQQVVEMEASKFQVAFEFFRRDVNFTALLDLNTSEKEIRGVVVRQWRQFWFEELESRELAVRHEKLLHAQRDLHELVVTPMMKRIRKNTVAQLQMDEFTHRQSFRAERVSGLAQLLPEMAASFTVALWGDVAHFARLAFTSNKAPLGLESIRRATIAHDEAAARVELHNAEWDILHVRGPLELVRNDESLSRIAMRKSHWLRIGDAAFRTFEAIHRDITFKESIEAEFNIFRPHTIAVSALMRARIEHLERHGRSELRQAVLHDRVDFYEVAENLHRQVLEQQCDAERRSELCRTESKIRATVRAAEVELFDSLHSSFNEIRRQLVVDFVETKESRRRYQIKLQMRFQTLNLTETFEKQVRMTLVKEAYNWRRQHVEGLEASLRVAMVSQRVAWMQKQTRACFETSWRQEMRTENTRRTLMTSNAFLHRYLIMRAALLNESLIEYKQKFVIEFALAERTLMSKLYYEGKMLRLDWMEGKSRRSLQDVLLLGRRVPLFTSFLLTAHAAARQSLLRDYLSTSGVTLLLEEEQLERHRVGVMQRLQDFSGIFVALSMSRKNSELRSAVCDIDRVLVPQWQLWQCYVKGAKSIAHEAIELIKTRQAEAKVAMLFLQPAVSSAKAASKVTKTLLGKTRATSETPHKRVVRSGLQRNESKLISVDEHGTPSEPPSFGASASAFANVVTATTSAPRKLEKSASSSKVDALPRETVAALLFERRCKRQDLATMRLEDLRNLKAVMLQEDRRRNASARDDATDIPYDPFDDRTPRMPRFRRDSDSSFKSLDAMPKRATSKADQAMLSSVSDVLDSDSADELFDPDSTQGHRTLKLQQARRELQEEGVNGSARKDSSRKDSSRRESARSKLSPSRTPSSSPRKSARTPIPELLKYDEDFDPPPQRTNVFERRGKPLASGVKKESAIVRLKAMVAQSHVQPTASTPAPPRTVQEVLAGIGKGNRSASVEPPPALRSVTFTSPGATPLSPHIAGSPAAAIRETRKSNALAATNDMAARSTFFREETNARNALLDQHAFGVAGVGMLAAHALNMTELCDTAIARYKRNLLTFQRRAQLTTLEAAEGRARVPILVSFALEGHHVMATREDRARQRLRKRAAAAFAQLPHDRLFAGTLTHCSLKSTEGLVSRNGRHRFVLRQDGNLVLESMPRTSKIVNDSLWTIRWESESAAGPDCRLVLQVDGNLVLYNAAGDVEWATHTLSTGAIVLVVHDDGDVTMHDRAGAVVWSSGTHETPVDVPIPMPAVLRAEFTDSDGSSDTE
jgi:hypothetical protein